MIKIIVVGDGAVGKTCALYSYVNDQFPTEYVPTVFENTLTSVNINNENVQLSLWDTAGQEGYENLRLISYQGTNIFFICFSVITPSSFNNALDKWYAEVQQHSKNGLIIFLGLKIDLREDDNPNHIHKKTVESLLKKNGCHYREASALTQQGLKEAFTFAIETYIIQSQKQIQEQKTKKKSKCQLI